MDESILEKVSENGVTTVHYHGSNRILAKTSTTLSPEYEYVTDAIELKAGADFRWDESLSSQMYPYLYSQRIMNWKAYADATLHILRFDLGVTIAYGDGSVKESERLVNEQSGVQTTPFRLQEWYERQMEFRTASYLETGLSARYNLRNGIYFRAEGEWIRGFNLISITGKDRFTAALGIGYEF